MHILECVMIIFKLDNEEMIVNEDISKCFINMLCLFKLFHRAQ